MTTAFLNRDASFDGIFFTAVHTTGIFCRPTCRARKPRPENVTFFATGGDALHAGYRPCKLCRPMDRAGHPPAWVNLLLDAVESDPTHPWRDRDVRAMDIDPVRARRWFKTHYGMTFQAYSRARRLGQALGQIKGGSSVIQAAYGQGYESLSGFNDAFRKLLGTAPKSTAPGPVIYLKRIASPLGLLLAGATTETLYLLEFMDRRAVERQLSTLQRRTGCTMLPGATAVHQQLEIELEGYFSGELRRFSVPHEAPGTVFQQAVWQALGAIPFGDTRSYQDVATALGRPSAVRAVARANGDNRLAILIPCHRVIGKDGSLTGYGGGLWRKQRLLELEGVVVDGTPSPSGALYPDVN